MRLLTQSGYDPGRDILARCAAISFSVGGPPPMEHLQPAEAASPPARSETYIEQVYQISQTLQTNYLVNLQLDLRFLTQKLDSALRRAAEAEQKAAQMSAPPARAQLSAAPAPHPLTALAAARQAAGEPPASAARRAKERAEAYQAQLPGARAELAARAGAAGRPAVSGAENAGPSAPRPARMELAAPASAAPAPTAREPRAEEERRNAHAPEPARTPGAARAASGESAAPRGARDIRASRPEPSVRTGGAPPEGKASGNAGRRESSEPRPAPVRMELAKPSAAPSGETAPPRAESRPAQTPSARTAAPEAAAPRAQTPFAHSARADAPVSGAAPRQTRPALGRFDAGEDERAPAPQWMPRPGRLAPAERPAPSDCVLRRGRPSEDAGPAGTQAAQAQQASQAAQLAQTVRAAHESFPPARQSAGEREASFAASGIAPAPSVHRETFSAQAADAPAHSAQTARTAQFPVASGIAPAPSVHREAFPAQAAASAPAHPAQAARTAQFPAASGIAPAPSVHRETIPAQAAVTTPARPTPMELARTASAAPQETRRAGIPAQSADRATAARAAQTAPGARAAMTPRDAAPGLAESVSEKYARAPRAVLTHAAAPAAASPQTASAPAAASSHKREAGPASSFAGSAPMELRRFAPAGDAAGGSEGEPEGIRTIRRTKTVKQETPSAAVQAADEASRRALADAKPAPIAPAEVERIADKVYRQIEARLRSEKARRGM